MRILVDGSELSAGGNEPSYWQATLPSLLNELKPTKVFLLKRPAPHTSFQLATSHVLNAPPVDFAKLKSEDRRLAALCSQLEIQLFISTGYTSAGGNVASCFIAMDSMKDQFEMNPDLRNAGIQSSQLASVHTSTSESSARQLHELSKLEMKYIHTSPDPHALATAIMDSYESAIPDAIRLIRERKEQEIRLEIERLHQVEQIEAQRQWQIAIDNFGKLPIFQRLWRALRNVRRYPEYARRMMRYGSKPGGVAL